MLIFTRAGAMMFSLVFVILLGGGRTPPVAQSLEVNVTSSSAVSGPFRPDQARPDSSLSDSLPKRDSPPERKDRKQGAQDPKLRSYHRASLKTRSSRKGSRSAELKRRRRKRWLKARHKDALSNSSAWNSSNASISISEEIRGIVESTLLASSSSPEEDLVGRRLMNTRMPIGIFDRSIVLIQYVAASLAAVAPCCVLGFMHPGFGSSRNPKLPPSWGPELESN